MTAQIGLDELVDQVRQVAMKAQDSDRVILLNAAEALRTLGSQLEKAWEALAMPKDSQLLVPRKGIRRVF